MSIKLEKNQTGIAGEYYVAGELSRLGFNVTVTFGNTKAVDLLVYKNEDVYSIQVKSIQYSSSVNWTVNKTKVYKRHYYVLVNLHVDNPNLKPEFFILTGSEVLILFNDTKISGQKRAVLNYKRLLKLSGYKDCWEKLGPSN